MFFSLNYNAPQKLTKLLWVKEDGSTPEGEVKRGRLKSVREGRLLPTQSFG